MSSHRPLLFLYACTLLGACAHNNAEKQLLDLKTANSRALEQRRMNVIAMNADQGLTERGAEIAVYDPDKVFDPRAAHFGHATEVATKSAQTTNFNFTDGVRTKEFAGTRSALTKNAWMGDLKYQTKDAQVKESWFSKLTARTKTFDTSKSRFSDKTMATRPALAEDKPFLVKGRRQADYDTKGPAAMALGGDRISGDSWTGDLQQLTKPLSVDDVKKLLNKN